MKPYLLGSKRKTKLPEAYDETATGDVTDAYLWSYRIKATAPRKKIVEFLEKEGRPVSIDYIVSKTKLNVSSVYRTVELFVARKLVTPIFMRGKEVVYEIRGKHHHHIVCVDCGDFEDVKNCSIQKHEQEFLLQAKKFVDIRDHSLEFFGLCKKCVN